MKTKLEKYIQKRLNTIQKKYNFSPTQGASQIKGRQELEKHYFVFKEFLQLVYKFNLNVNITGFETENLNQQSFVYFAYTINDPWVWKIGKSIKPPKRVATLEGGNPDNLIIKDQIVGDLSVEKLFKDYFEKYKTRDKNKRNKGEWFRIQPQIVVNTIARFKKEGKDFLLQPLARS